MERKIQIAKLFQSIYKEDYASLKKLFEVGPKNLLDSSDPISGLTPLIASILKNDKLMILKLLMYGVDPNKANFLNKTPLMYACEIGNKEIVEILCSNKCHLNCYDDKLKSCLAYCCNLRETNINLECVEVLLGHNIDVNLNIKGSTPFLDLCKMSNSVVESLCVRLISRANVHDCNFALHYASENGSIKLCYALLQNGCNPYQLNSLGQTPISLAALHGHLNILKLFWSFNVNLNYIDKLGHSLFYYVIKNFTANNHNKLFYSLIKYLSCRGCLSLNESDYENIPPKVQQKVKRLNRIYVRKFNMIISKSSTSREFTIWMMKIKDFLQALSGILQFKEYFKTSQIDYEQFERFFKTYFIETFPSGILKKLFNSLKIDQAKELINSQKILNPKIYTKLTNPLYSFDKPIFLKKKLKPNKVKKVLNKFQKFKMYIPSKKSEAINFQIRKFKCNDLNRFKTTDLTELRNDSKWYVDTEKETLIEFANIINSGDLATLEEILATKSVIEREELLNSTDKYYKTPLMVAIMNEKFDVIDFLLKKKVNITLKDNFKWTALHHAIQNENFKVIKKLVELDPKLKLMKTIGGSTSKLLADRLGMIDISYYLSSLDKINKL